MKPRLQEHLNEHLANLIELKMDISSLAMGAATTHTQYVLKGLGAAIDKLMRDLDNELKINERKK